MRCSSAMRSSALVQDRFRGVAGKDHDAVGVAHYRIAGADGEAAHAVWGGGTVDVVLDGSDEGDAAGDDVEVHLGHLVAVADAAVCHQSGDAITKHFIECAQQTVGGLN